jgi:glycosyltransferase involved in cell wall biosynthesis
MKVGVLYYRWDYYPYTRTILHQVPGVTYRPVHDLYSTLNRVVQKVNRTSGRTVFPHFDLNNQFQDFGLNHVDLLHFFNGISYGKTPWISNFETLLPRLSGLLAQYNQRPQELHPDRRARRAFDALSGDACKQLIALSGCARTIQLDLLSRLPFDTQAIQRKLTVLHPPQEKMIADYDEKGLDPDGPVRFILVGAGFFRKGGREILRVFERLVRQQHYPIELVIVSSLRMDQYAAHETEADIAWAQATIAANRDWITHHTSLPNEQVLALIREAHAGLLPTYADTYGFSVLECQANGTPVISTNVRALPEINPPDAGWLIDVPCDDLGEGLYATAEQRTQLSAAIETGLERVLHGIFADRASLRRKGIAALARIQQQHDPIRYEQQLGEIYAQALKAA